VGPFAERQELQTSLRQDTSEKLGYDGVGENELLVKCLGREAADWISPEVLEYIARKKAE